MWTCCLLVIMCCRLTETSLLIKSFEIMTRKCDWKFGDAPRQQWTLENLKGRETFEKRAYEYEEGIYLIGDLYSNPEQEKELGRFGGENLDATGRHIILPVRVLGKAFTLVSRF